MNFRTYYLVTFIVGFLESKFIPFSIFICIFVTAAAFLLEHPSLEGETPPAKKRRSVSCFRNTFHCLTFLGEGTSKAV